ncbi:MAG: RsmE family RNA methyltransferase [Kofleriaceae bacterium]
MTARLLVAPDQLVAGQIVVDGDGYGYLFRARRLPVGAPVELFDGAGRAAAAVVASVGPSQAVLTVGAVVAQPRPGPHLTVLQALVKGERMDWCLEKLVEVGVDHVVPCETSRTVVRLDPARRASRHQRFVALAEAAARQCGRADVPTVGAIVPLAAALTALTASRRLVADPGGAPLAATAAAAPSVAILIGPEGGLAPDELAAALDHGFEAVSLGPTILRAETAGMIVAAAVRLFAPTPPATV